MTVFKQPNRFAALLATGLAFAPTVEAAQQNITQAAPANQTTQTASQCYRDAAAKCALPPVIKKAPVHHVVHRQAPRAVAVQSDSSEISWDATKPIRVPMAAPVGEVPLDLQLYVDASACNPGKLRKDGTRGSSFMRALGSPFNAPCIENNFTQTTTLVGVVRAQVGPDHKAHAMFTATQPALLSVSRGSTGSRGEGWSTGIAQLVGAGAQVGSVIEQARSIGIAKQSLKATINQNASINNAITNGKFSSLYGSLNCASSTAIGSKTGNVNSTCVVNSPVSDSTIGQDSATRNSNTGTGISATYGVSPN